MDLRRTETFHGYTKLVGQDVFLSYTNFSEDFENSHGC